MMRLTKSQYNKLKHRIIGDAPKPTKRGMNETEKKYAQMLELKKRGGVIHDWKFEPIKLRLAEGLYYIPDFLVIYHDAQFIFEFHEVKGAFIRRSGLNKFQMAREAFPWFTFRMMQYENWQWNEIRKIEK